MDENTKFFHNFPNSWKKINMISGIDIVNGAGVSTFYDTVEEGV